MTSQAQLGRRQVRATLLVAIVVGLVLNTLHVVQDGRREQARMEQIGAGILALVQGSAARAAYTYDRTLAETVVASLTGLPSVVGARLEDNLGAALAEAERRPVAAPLRWLTDAAFGARRLMRQSLLPPPPPPGAPAIPEDAPIGVLTVELDTRALADDLVARSIRLFLLGLVKTALLAGAMLAVAQWLVTRPLARLADAVDAIEPAATGARVTRPPGHDGDELGRLAEAIDALLDRFGKAERARETLERRFLSAAACMPDGLVVLDPAGRIAFMNEPFILNAPPALRAALAIGRDFAECLDAAAPLFHPSLGPDPVAARTAALAAADADGDVMLADGRVLRLRLRPMPDGGRILMTTDVTQPRRMAEDLRRAEKLAAVGTLAGGVAHDFNNLLATIHASAELALAKQPENGAARPALGRILDAGRRGRALVEQVMAFSRAERATPGRCDLAEAAIAAAGLAWGGLLPASGAPTLTTQRPDRPLPVAANETQVHQIVSNLLANAAHAATPGGTVRLRIATEADMAVVSVADDGPGMDEATRSRVFEPFFTTKPVGKGSGLGLAVVWGVVRALGGRVDVDSAPGRGTTVTVRLPLAAEGPLHAAASAAVSRG